MARRRGGEIGGSLDSLLDTMTNVVGILIIVLIITQLNVSSAAKRIRANLPDVDAADLAEARAALQAEQVRLEQLRSAEDAAPVTPEALDELRRQREQFEEKLAAVDKGKEEMAKLRARAEAAGKDAAAAAKEAAERERQLAELVTQRDDARSKAPREARVVRLPNPREPEQGSKEVRLVCRGGKVLPADTEAIAARMADKIKARRDLLVAGRNDLFRRADLEKWLATVKDVDPNFTGQFFVLAGGWVHLHLFPKDGKGEPPEFIGRPESAVRRVLAEAGFQRNYVRFYVTADSFEAYVAARARAEKMNLPVGWVFAEDSGKLVVGVPGVRAEPAPDYKPGPAPPPPPDQQPRKDILD